MMTYAIFTTEGMLAAYIASPHPPTPEEMADHCAAVYGFPDRDEWIAAYGILSLAFAPVH